MTADPKSDTVDGERAKHADARVRSPATEKRNQVIAGGVALTMTAGLLWLLWTDKSAPRKAEKPVIRNTATFEPAMDKTPPKATPRINVATAPTPALAPVVVQPPPPPIDPLIEAARRAPVLAVTKREMQATGTAVTPFGFPLGEIEPEDKGAFERRLKPPRLDGVRAGLIGDLNFVVPQGTAIPCILETAMQSDQPGFVSCVIPRDVLSANGRVVLMERGTQVVGEYRGGLRQGQVRLHVLWSRARTPKGVVVELASAATDELGRAGVGGTIDTHWWERFGSALLLSVVSDASRAAVKAAQSATGESSAGVGNAGNQAAAIAVEQSINMPPTLHKHQGEHVGIFVARDLDFSSVYSLKTVAAWPSAKVAPATTHKAPAFMSGGGNGRSIKD